ncbi:MAG: ATP-dependent helicase [Alphaproteobacteria bacterium]
MDLFEIDDDDLYAETSSQEASYLEGLNEVQTQAVTATDGPVLILAGAGTGKTRVLTIRLAHILMSNLAFAHEILAVTFTNKAAAEMRERIASITSQPVDGWWVGTFHALSARILRRHAEFIARTSNFLILDTDDSERLIKGLMQEFAIDEKRYPPRMVSAVIQRWKDKGLNPSDVRLSDGSDFADGRVLKLYARYQQRLAELDAVDFGDMLLLCLNLFKQQPEILKRWQQKFRYILVDEYQDTNVAQYLWLRLLAQGYGNLCCVGDDDQSIYSWRGAEVGNILRFEKDFEKAQIFRLEQNYRSTGHILGAASGIISHNRGRLGKTLWTNDDKGEKVTIVSARDGDEEARLVVLAMNNLKKDGEGWQNMAVLVRTSFQTRAFEEQLIAKAIPYRVVGGARFYERQEIRDAMAYLRLLQRPSDDLAFERIINVPKRGLGAGSLQKIQAFAREHDKSLFDAAQIMVSADNFSGKAGQSLKNFVHYFESWRQQQEELSHGELVEKILEDSGYLDMWKQDKSPDAEGRVENLKELVSAISEFESLAEFLEHVSLVMENETQAGEDRVTLMTLHGAKGLEFDNVFLPGWEEGLFPNQRAIDENGNEGLEEERRLAYVGITRGRKRVIILAAATRMLYGRWQTTIPSRFLDEIPIEHVELKTPMGGRVQPMRNASDISADEVTTKYIDDNASPWHVGAKVVHRIFGEGQIKKIDGDRLTIYFAQVGEKKVVKSFVELLEE